MKEAAIVEYKIRFEGSERETQGYAYFIVGKSSTGKNCIILEELGAPVPGHKCPIKGIKVDYKEGIKSDRARIISKEEVRRIRRVSPLLVDELFWLMGKSIEATKKRLPHYLMSEVGKKLIIDKQVTDGDKNGQ